MGLNLNCFRLETIRLTWGPIEKIQETFDITINDPPNLMVQTNINKAHRRLDLTLSGSNQYLIDINGSITEINYSGRHSIPIKQDIVDLKVSTSNGCQGIYQERLMF